jgi:hypothetical protein
MRWDTSSSVKYPNIWMLTAVFRLIVFVFCYVISKSGGYLAYGRWDKVW